MAATLGVHHGPEPTAMERFGSGGMALLPWPKQMLTVVWEQLRLLVQVIYYTFMSVFQMFRFEVHVRITDETVQHIQHMSTAANPSDSFLFSSLFDGERGVMVGGSNHISDFCAEVGDPFAEDICCGLVDDFVARAGGGGEEAVFLGHPSAWKMGFPGDWNIFVSSSGGGGDASGSGEDAAKAGARVSEDDRSAGWSGEEDRSGAEFDSEESKALWESLSKSSDPYNPFFFSACISTSADVGKREGGTGDGGRLSAGRAGEDAPGPQGIGIWFGRSDSESSWSSSGSSSPDVDKEESERLWEFFSSPADPYNPMCFSACAVSNIPLHAAAPKVQDAADGGFPPQSDDGEDEEERLWESLCLQDDPYHPLNFQACLQSSPVAAKPPALLAADPPALLAADPPPEECDGAAPADLPPRATKPRLSERTVRPHSHPDKTLVPWKKTRHTPRCPQEDETKTAAAATSSSRKKVRFSPLVQVHTMRTWRFARQASRKGPWEEMARDRDRFRRRIHDAERAIGPCLAPDRRAKVLARLDAGRA